MIKVIISSNKREISYYSVQEDPTPGSFGDYILLKEQYKNLDMDWLMFGNSTQVKQALFNMAYLKEMEKIHGPLHCAYCGQEELKIFEFHDRKDYKIMATTDHILPKKLYPELAFNKSNLTVACSNCNNKKGEKHLDIKFPYNGRTITESNGQETS